MENRQVLFEDYEKEGIQLLKEFGLEEEESRIYLGLLRIGSAKASEISTSTKIDRVKGYKILDSLKNRGFVISTLSSPTLFSAINPKLALKEIIEKKRQETERLEKNIERLSEILKHIKTQQTEVELPKLTVVSGRNNIYEQIIKLINSSKDEVYIITTASDVVRLYYTDLPEVIKNTLKRKVVIRLLTELEITTKLDCVSRLGIEYFKISKLPSRGRIICNSSQALMSGYTSTSSNQNTNEESALITNSDEILGNMKSLCKFLWNIGKEVRTQEKNSTPSISKTPKHTTALIVDDDPDTVEMFSDYLEIKGVKVVGKCNNGKEGYDAYCKLLPDVIFLDIMMPDYDGFYALQKIREKNADAKIVIITADITAETRKKLQEVKPLDVIYKPYDVEKVLDSLS